MIARFHTGYPFPYLHDDTRSFMAQNDREKTFGVIARQGKGIGVAYASIRDLDKNFALARRLNVNLNDFQRLSRPEGNCCT